MNAPQQTQTDQPTPEQLLQMLDLQLARERSKREGGSRKRATILVFGVLAIAVAAGIALLVAQQMLMDLQERSAGARQSGTDAVMSEKL